MEISQAARRILLCHALLIGSVVIFGLTFSISRNAESLPTFTASVRLTLDMPDPTSAAESTAIADTARAIVTSPGRLDSVLRQNGISVDAAEFAADSIEVQAMGTSGVLRLSVTAGSSQTAADVANALAEGLIDTRLHVSGGQAKEAKAAFDEQIDRALEQAVRVDEQIESETAPSVLAALRERRLHLAQQASLLEQQRADLVAAQALRPEPAIVDTAVPPARADASTRAQDIALGFLLSLIAGVALAAVVETVRPSVVGPQAVASFLGAPLLGTLRQVNREGELSGLESIGRRLHLSAAAHGVRGIILMRIHDAPDLDSLSADLLGAVRGQGHEFLPGGYALPGERPQTTESEDTDQARRAAIKDSEPPGAIFVQSLAAFEEARSEAGGNLGLVTVAPPTIKARDALALRDLRWISEWPLLGVVVFEGRRITRLRRSSIHEKTSGRRLIAARPRQLNQVARLRLGRRNTG